MPSHIGHNLKISKSIRGISPTSESPTLKFDPAVAGRAIVDGLHYLKNRLDWSGTKIATTLHLPSNTVNTWLKNGIIPIHNSVLQPDIQAIIHLLAIHRSLEAMFENPTHQCAWLSTFHPELNVIPEKLMSESIDGLIFIRQYLDYIRGRGA
ncbi:MAG: MbcA/ParS/Xre antitoxin family protein [Gammaproteobacteria bacterium]